MKRLPGVVYAVLAVALASGAALTGCGSDNPRNLPEYEPGQAGAQMSGDGPKASADGADRTPSTSAPTESDPIPTVSREPSPASTDVTYTPADALGEGAWVERGTVKVRNKQALGAVDAVLGYLTQRVQLSNTWTVDEDALAAVATGQAVTSARERALSQEAAERRSIGRFVVNVSSVRLRDGLATVTGCHFDATSEVDQNGYVLVPPPGGVLISMKVQFAQGVWRVTSWPEKQVPTCTGWKK